MYCPEGENKTEDGDIESVDQIEFIEQLSNKVAYQPDKIIKEPKKLEKKKLRIKLHKGWIITISILLIIITASVGGYLYLRYETSPKQVAKGFFLAVVNHKADTLYNQLEFVESDFINKVAFTSMIEQSANEEITSYVITPQDSSNLGTTYKVEYVKKGSNDINTLIIRLITQTKKKYFFFNSYKVDPSDMIVENYMIKVPKGSNVKLDSVELKDELLNKKQDSEEYDIYTIPALLNKEYNLTVMKEGKKEVTDTIQLTNNYQVTTMELSSKSSASLIKQASDDIKKIYKAALQREPYSDIKDLFSSNYDTIQTRSDNYQAFVNSLSKENGAGITNLSFSDISGEISNTEGAKVSVTIGYNAEIGYIVISGSPQVKRTESKSGYYRNNLTYIHVGDKWLLDEFEYNSYGFN